VKNLVSSFGRNFVGFFQESKNILAFIGEVTEELIFGIRNPHKIKWKSTLYYMDGCGREATGIVALICFLMGLILGFQSAVQMKQFGTDIYVANLVGLSIVKELGPLMVAMIATGRAGSAFAAELGTMRVNEEIDALTTMGFVPPRFLIIPKLIAMMVVMPILTLIGDLLGILGGFFVGVVQLKLPFIAYLNQTIKAIHYLDVMESMAKAFAFAIIISMVGCYRGMNSSSDAQGVGKAATSSVVSGIFLIIVADTLMTIIFTQLRG
jgi:phospholipid/cholesterol/gamma-HCH transport system permease protein